MDYPQYEDLLAQSNAYLRAANSKMNRMFSVGDLAHYQYDLRRSEIWWSNPGDPRVRARVIVVGSTSDLSDSWLWSWANPHLKDIELGPIDQVREFGVKAGIEKLSEPTFPAEESDAWEMTAIAARLLEADGAYRSPGKNGSLFFVLEQVELIPEEDKARYLTAPEPPAPEQ